MTDDITSPPGGSGDIEARLRDALMHKAGGDPIGDADWGDLAGRLASSTRRRHRVLAGVAGAALVVGAAGGYLGEAAGSPGPVAARPTNSKALSGGRAAAGEAGPSTPSSAGPMVMCPDETSGSPSSASAGTSSSAIGSATRLFVRTTTDGVTIRVYSDAGSGVSCIGSPTPLAGSGSGADAGTGTTGAAGTAGTTATTGSVGSAVVPLVPVGQDVTVEMSDADAVGQGAISSPQCAVSPEGGASGSSGSGTGSGSGTAPGSGPVSGPEGTVAPLVTPATPTTPATPPTTSAPTTTTSTQPTASPPVEPSALETGAFGVLEGDPVWWVAVEVGTDVSSVQMTFPDGTTDEMAPVDGVAVLAHRLAPAVASVATGPYEVRGTLELLGADGSVMDSVTLPQTSTAVPVPSPEPGLPMDNQNATVTPGVIVACPPSTLIPQAQSSPTEKR